MSVAAVKWAYECSRAQGATHAVLVAICWHMGRESGLAWMGMDAIVAAARVAESTAKKAIADLLRLGELAISEQGGGRGRANAYYLPGLHKGADSRPLSEYEKGPKRGRKGAETRAEKGPKRGRQPTPIEIELDRDRNRIPPLPPLRAVAHRGDGEIDIHYSPNGNGSIADGWPDDPDSRRALLDGMLARARREGLNLDDANADRLRGALLAVPAKYALATILDVARAEQKPASPLAVLLHRLDDLAHGGREFMPSDTHLDAAACLLAAGRAWLRDRRQPVGGTEPPHADPAAEDAIVQKAFDDMAAVLGVKRDPEASGFHLGIPPDPPRARRATTEPEMPDGVNFAKLR